MEVEILESMSRFMKFAAYISLKKTNQYNATVLDAVIINLMNKFFLRTLKLLKHL